MIGDDLVNDVGGAQHYGIKGVQVRTGKYRSEMSYSVICLVCWAEAASEVNVVQFSETFLLISSNHFCHFLKKESPNWLSKKSLEFTKHPRCNC